MIVTVINDKESVLYNSVFYGCGESFEVDDTIGKSLIERGYVAEIDEAKDIKDLSYPELKKLASQMGLSASGRKEDLIARISAAEVDNSAEDDKSEDNENAAQEENLDGTDSENAAGEMPDTNMPE